MKGWTSGRAKRLAFCAAALLAGGAPFVGAAEDDEENMADPYLWLEEVEGKRALDWVKEKNRATTRSLANRAAFKALRQKLLDVFDSDDRIPYIDKLGAHYYNFWRDKTHPRGLWRRTTLESYAGDEPDWEPVLDLDALAREEDENWVLSGFFCREPDYRRCLVRLSRGGADAVVTREFDLEAKAFVRPEDGGFALPEAKGTVDWAGQDAIFVATDFGPGSMTDSGYPRIVKLWRRGQPLDAAHAVFEGEASDVSIGAYSHLDAGHEVHVVWRATDFYNSEMYIWAVPDLDDPANAKLLRIDKPADASVTIHRGRLFMELKSAWAVAGASYSAGSLLATSLAAFLDGERTLDVVFQPSAGTSLASFAPTRNHVLLNVLDNVKNRVVVATPAEEGWTFAPLPLGEDARTASVEAVAAHEDDRYFVDATDYLTPPTLSLGAVGDGAEVLKRAPAYFDASGLAVSQHWVESKDGTRIPYYQVAPSEVEGPLPTLLYGYGGFEIAMLPRYSAGVGIGWLAQGGAYVVANIRGGGEFGPAWHQAALKENRARAFEDFIAVAEDLVRRGVAEPARLGILGGSNGGLLMGNMLTMRPALFGAIAAQVPLMDMRRYHRLLAGASWMAEYGDPDDPADWRFLRAFSPYHNVREDAEYPPLLVTTSMRDDRVHPGHARKMVAKMQDMGHDATYYENIEGGHGGAADNAQSAFMWALVYRFLWRELGGDG